MTAVLLLGLSSLRTSAQNTISITNVQGSETTSPYINYESYEVQGEMYSEYVVRWNGYITFEASGYTLPLDVIVFETSGTEYSVSKTFNDANDTIFMVDNLIPGTYMIQITDSNNGNGTYEQGVTIVNGGCDNVIMQIGHPDLNVAWAYLTDGTSDLARCYDFDAMTWSIYRGDTLVYTRADGDDWSRVDLSHIEGLEYDHVYNVEFEGSILGGCSWTMQTEILYTDACQNFFAELGEINDASMTTNDGSVTIWVNSISDNFFAAVHNDDYTFYDYYNVSEVDSLFINNLAQSGYEVSISDDYGCETVLEFSIERNCNLLVGIERVWNVVDSVELEANALHAVAYYFDGDVTGTYMDSIALDGASFTWEQNGEMVSTGDYFEFYDGGVYVVTAEYNGCTATNEYFVEEATLTSTCGPIEYPTVNNASIAGNNGSISDIRLSISDMPYPYTVYLFDAEDNSYGSNEVTSDSSNYTYGNLPAGEYRIYIVGEECQSFATTYVGIDCESMEVSAETYVDDTTSNFALIAVVNDTRENVETVLDDEAYEWNIDGYTYSGRRILDAEMFAEQGQLTYSYTLSVRYGDCIQYTDGEFTLPNDCDMNAEITNITPMNNAASENDQYAVISISVNGGTAPYLVNTDGSIWGGANYETDNFEYYLYEYEMQDTSFMLYITDAEGCIATVAIPQFPSCSLAVRPVYNSNTSVTLNIIAEGDDYYPVSIYCDEYSDTFIGSTTTSSFDIPENRITVWGTYTLVADNGCTYELRLDESEICNMQLVDITTSNPTSDEIENGSVTINIAGGVAPYYGTYYKFIGEESSFYFHFATETAPITISNLSTGTYVFGINDMRGCMLIVPSDSTFVTLESDCNIMSRTENVSGNAVITIEGGVAPFVITDDAGVTYTANENTLTIENLTPGLHFYTIVDARGCMTYDNADAIPDTCENVQIFVNGNVTPTSSAAVPNGSITLTVEGGEAPYTYFWSNAETTESLDNLYPDEYWVYVTDRNGCYGVGEFEVEYVPTDNLFNELYIDVNYHIEVITVPTADGPVEAPFAVAHVQAIAGVPPYSYEWNVPSTYNTEQALAIYESGAVCVNVTDNAGSEVSGCIYIELPSADQISNEIVEEVAGVVDTCINSSAIADAHVTNVELEEGTRIYHVTWVLIEKEGIVHEIVVDYPVDSLATGIYAFNLYLNCNGHRAVSTFSTRIYLNNEGGDPVDAESFSIETASVNAYPNPFNDMLNITIDAVENDNVAINVYNVSGQMIYTINTEVSNGANNIEIATSNYGAGVYFINVVGNSINETIKVVK